MTAGHVSGKIKELIGICKARKVEVERAIFMVYPHEDRVDFVTAELDERIARHYQVQKPTGSTMPDDVDIAVCKVLAEVEDLPSQS